MTQTMNNLKNDSGFTLVEVLIAALLVSAGMVAYAMTAGNVTKQNAQSKKDRSHNPGPGQSGVH